MSERQLLEDINYYESILDSAALDEDEREFIENELYKTYKELDEYI